MADKPKAVNIKVTPFNCKYFQLEGTFRVNNFYYLARHHSAGMVTEIEPNDDWLDEEMSWVSRSELPFLTAVRHSQLNGQHLVEGALTPVVRKFRPFFKILTVDKFPTNEECMQLIYKY